MVNVDYRHKGRHVDVQLGHHIELDVAVLAADVWAYVDSHIQRTFPQGDAKRALEFWRQAERFASNLRSERYEASPLHLYYMILNATKALLVLRKLAPPVVVTRAAVATDDFSSHGIASLPSPRPNGQLPGSVKPKKNGVYSLLAKAMNDKLKSSYSLEELVSSVVCVHRAYCTTRKTAEKFIPVSGPFRLKQLNGNAKVFFEAWLPKHVQVNSVSGAMPEGLECGAYPTKATKGEPKPYIRQKGRRPTAILRDTKQLGVWHAKLRRSVHVIASQNGPSYYVCRSDTSPTDLSQLSLNFAVAFALSSLARYHPDTLQEVLTGKDGWVIKEYLCATPQQFVALIAAEITGRIIQRPYSDLR